MGRQGQRSGAAVRNHQRQYSDDYLDASSNGRWLQTAGLQSLYSNTSAPQVYISVYPSGFLLLCRACACFSVQSSSYVERDGNSPISLPCLCFLLDPISSKKLEFVSNASSWVSIVSAIC